MDLNENNINTNEPYEYLYNIKNKFENMQETKRFESEAKAMNPSKYKYFKDLNKAFIENKEEKKNYDKMNNSYEYDKKKYNTNSYMLSEKGIINLKGEVICYQIILPVARYINIEDNTEKVKCVFKRDGRWKNFTVNMTNVSHASKIIELADKGVDVTSENSRELIKYINEILNLNLDIIERTDSTSKMGWHDGNFLPYDDNIEYDGDDHFNRSFKALSCKGSREKWYNEMIEVRKNKVVKLCHALSIASILIDKLGCLPFVMIIWGKTGDGKTVAGMTGMSFWGYPDKGHLYFKLENTNNFSYRYASFMNNLPVFFDELQTYSAGKYSDINKFIMNMTEGIDKGKAKASGGVENTLTWNNAFLITGEETASTFNSGGGTMNRLLEINTSEKIIENGRKTVSIIKENYGFAGPEMVQIIKKYDTTMLSELLEDFKNKIINETNTEEKQAISMALILLADFLLCENIFKEDKMLRIKDIKGYVFDKDEIDSVERAYDYLINFIAVNRAKFSSSYETMVAERWGEIQDNEILKINKNILFKTLNDAGFNPKSILKELAKRNYIKRNSQGKNFHQTSINGIRGSYCFIVLKGDE